jgi:uncharacterized protein (TIGR02594 family)
VTDQPFAVPDDIDRKDLTLEELDRVKKNRADEAAFQGWKISFNEVKQEKDLWTLEVRYHGRVITMARPGMPDVPPVPSLDQPDPPPPGQPSDFISARKILPTTMVFIDAEGREVIREGGSRSWRCFNPGNIRKGSFAKMCGAIGDDGSFAAFPDENTGFAAIVSLLQSKSYRSLSLHDAIFRYAPPSENQSAAYLKFVIAQTGLSANAIMEKLKLNELRKVAKSIRELEGWKEGKERPNQPASGTSHSNAGSILGISAAIGASYDWMSIAEQEAALPEHERSTWPDPKENPRIVEYFRVAAAWFEHEGDETDWCAAFVNYCLVKSGHFGTDHPGARSFFWNKKGQFIKLNAPKKGAIAVRRYSPFNDPKWQTGKGHVGFIVSSTSSTITLLGGNQSNTVKVQSFPLQTADAKFVAFMMPAIS